jgi:hypothetical protein
VNVVHGQVRGSQVHATRNEPFVPDSLESV